MFENVTFIKSAHTAKQFPADAGAEVAFAGRSNAGKSSAINAITGRKSLARTSKTPGRTQLINFFAVTGEERLVDLPGYGYARVPDSLRDHWRKLMDAYFGKRRSLRGLILIMDARRPLLDFDWQMLRWAQARETPVHVLLTKSDKLSRSAAREQLQAAEAMLDGLASAQLFSATKGIGLDEARAAVHRLLRRAA